MRTEFRTIKWKHIHTKGPKTFFCILLLVLASCATYRPQISDTLEDTENNERKIAKHTFFIAGGYGTQTKNDADNPVLQKLTAELRTATDASTLLFTGDNIGPKGNDQNQDKELLRQQFQFAKDFKGKTVFLQGDHEWKSKDTGQIDEIEDYIDDMKGIRAAERCPLEQISINEDLDLILVNSKWFMTDWDQVKHINRSCDDIVTKRRFLEQLQNYINDAQGKNLVVAMHHPVFSNGRYAGEYTLKSQLLPFPILGSLITGFESLGGFSPRFTSSFRYGYYQVLMSFLAQESERITFVSGHDQNLQFLSGQNGTHQIISGALGSIQATNRSTNSISTFGGTLEYEGLFTHAANGFAKLVYYEDGSSRVSFVTEEGTRTLDNYGPYKPYVPPADYGFPASDSITKSIVENPNDLKKSKFYKYLWGNRYRDYFTQPITAPVANLDTLKGGLALTKRGGGHQSYTLRFEDKNEKQFALRSLDKNALRILKYNMFGSAYNIEEFENTATEDIIYDFFTTSPPYLLPTISPLAKAAKVNHATANLFYVPKQAALDRYNPVYGDRLYFLEERPSEEWANNPGYTRSLPDAEGAVTDFESTTDMMAKLREDESYSIDERSLVRARLFDMLIGDWDRHADQYRWAEYEVNDDDKRFVIIPRDRDNAFPKFDGVGVPFLQLFIPLIRSWQTYEAEIKNLKWLNDKANMLDRALINKNGTELWIEEAQAMQQNLNEVEINKAFDIIPDEIKGETSETIKQNLKQRLADLTDYAKQYGEYLNRRIVLHGTDKDDIIRVIRQADGRTTISLRRNLSDEKNELFYRRTFEASVTKEIWIYGLNDDDRFIVEGNGDKEIFIRLIGGYGEDLFEIHNKKSLKVYDHTYGETVFTNKIPRKQLTNQYNTNLYHWRRLQENHNVFTPGLGYRVDDGFFLGGTDTYTVNGFNGNPFRQKHTLSAKYYTAFSAVELNYKGVFANVFPSINYEVEGYFTNNRYVNNYFGIGNETVNLEDDLDIDFYRARIGKLKLGTGLALKTLRLSLNYERFEVQNLADRIFNTNNFSPEIFDGQHYLGSELSVYYKNDDNKAFPTRYFYLGLQGGYKANTELSDIRFGYAGAKLSLARKLVPSGNIVLSSTLEGKTNIGDGYFFYHAPSIGGNNGLRGFRDERFTGKRTFYQSSDFRFRLKRYPTSVAPITVGVFAGFDYGRVWTENDNSNIWHTSQGGGIWVSGLNDFGLNIGFFNSNETNMFQVGLGFDF